METSFNINDTAFLVEHSVYGDPKSKVNEPYIIRVAVINIETNEKGVKYILSGMNSPLATDSDGTNLFHTKQEAVHYIAEHRDEIIAKSFKEHNKWFQEQLKRVRKIN